MIRNVLALGFMGLVSIAAGAEARADAPVRVEARGGWGHHAGWTFLGETRVHRGSGYLDLDRGERRLDRIMIVAKRGFVDVNAVRVHLVDGGSYVARVGRFDGRTVVDLPDQGRVRGLELIAHGGRGRRFASLEVYGDLERRPHQPQPAPYPQPAPQPAPQQWETLGSAFIDGRRDMETIYVGRDEGRFHQLMLRTTADVGLHNVTVTFLNGDTQAVGLRQGRGADFIIDLPGDARGIRAVSFSASSRGVSPNARVDLLAM